MEKAKDIQEAVSRMAACLNAAALEFNTLMELLEGQGLLLPRTPPPVLDTAVLDEEASDPAVLTKMVEEAKERTPVWEGATMQSSLADQARIEAHRGNITGRQLGESMADFDKRMGIVTRNGASSAEPAPTGPEAQQRLQNLIGNGISNIDTILSEAEVVQEFGSHTMAFIQASKVASKKELKVRLFDNDTYIEDGTGKKFTKEELSKIVDGTSITVIWGEGHAYMFEPEETLVDFVVASTIGDSPDYPPEAKVTFAPGDVEEVFDARKKWASWDRDTFANLVDGVEIRNGLQMYLCADVVKGGIGSIGTVTRPSDSYLEKFRDDIMTVGPSKSGAYKKGIYRCSISGEPQLFIPTFFPVKSEKKIAFVLTNFDDVNYHIWYTKQLGDQNATWTSINAAQESEVESLFLALMSTLKQYHERSFM